MLARPLPYNTYGSKLMKSRQFRFRKLDRESKLSIHNRYDTNAKIILFHGDTNDLIASLPDRSIKLIITSPPYNLGKEYETRVELSNYIDQQSKIISEFSRVLQDNGSICWQV